MIRTGVSGLLEHFVAYIITGLAFMIGHKDHRPLHLAIALSAYAAVLEAGQLVAPGRNAGVLDWASSAAGAFSAMLLIWACQARA